MESGWSNVIRSLDAANLVLPIPVITPAGYTLILCGPTLSSIFSSTQHQLNKETIHVHTLCTNGRPWNSIVHSPLLPVFHGRPLRGGVIAVPSLPHTCKYF